MIASVAESLVPQLASSKQEIRTSRAEELPGMAVLFRALTAAWRTCLSPESLKALIITHSIRVCPPPAILPRIRMQRASLSPLDSCSHHTDIPRTNANTMHTRVEARQSLLKTKSSISLAASSHRQGQITLNMSLTSVACSSRSINDNGSITEGSTPSNSSFSLHLPATPLKSTIASRARAASTMTSAQRNGVPSKTRFPRFLAKLSMAPF